MNAKKLLIIMLLATSIHQIKTSEPTHYKGEPLTLERLPSVLPTMPTQLQEKVNQFTTAHPGLLSTLASDHDLNFNDPELVTYRTNCPAHQRNPLENKKNMELALIDLAQARAFINNPTLTVSQPIKELANAIYTIQCQLQHHEINNSKALAEHGFERKYCTLDGNFIIRDPQNGVAYIISGIGHRLHLMLATTYGDKSGESFKYFDYLCMRVAQGAQLAPSAEIASMAANAIKCKEVLGKHNINLVDVPTVYLERFSKENPSLYDGSCFAVQEIEPLYEFPLSTLHKDQLEEFLTLVDGAALWTFSNQNGTGNHLGVNQNGTIIYSFGMQPNNTKISEFYNKNYVFNLVVGYQELRHLMRHSVEQQTIREANRVKLLTVKYLDALEEGNQESITSYETLLNQAQQNVKTSCEPLVELHRIIEKLRTAKK